MKSFINKNSDTTLNKLLFIYQFISLFVSAIFLIHVAFTYMQFVHNLYSYVFVLDKTCL